MRLFFKGINKNEIAHTSKIKKKEVLFFAIFLSKVSRAIIQRLFKFKKKIDTNCAF